MYTKNSLRDSLLMAVRHIPSDDRLYSMSDVISHLARWKKISKPQIEISCSIVNKMLSDEWYGDEYSDRDIEMVFAE